MEDCNGDKVRIWGESWLPNCPGFKLFNSAEAPENEAQVYDLIDSDFEMWNIDKGPCLFQPYGG